VRWRWPIYGPIPDHAFDIRAVSAVASIGYQWRERRLNGDRERQVASAEGRAFSVQAMHPIKDKRALVYVAARYIKTGIVHFFAPDHYV
jgi:hypothetical protein